MTQRAAMFGSAKKTEADLLMPGRHEKDCPDNMFFSAPAQKMTQKILQERQRGARAPASGEALK